MIESITRVVHALAGAILSALKPRTELVVENLALRQQVLALSQKHPRPKLGPADRFLWTLLRAGWTNWRVPLEIVQPDTVVRWHRYGFRLFWRWKSLRGPSPGRPKVDRQVRCLIRQMAAENDWGAPRIHAELQKLGFTLSERSVSRYVPRRPGTPEQIERWKSFLRNHRQAIAAMDLFVVPTATFRLLYGLVIIHHDRRQVLHFNATEHPTEDWMVQQLREAFPEEPEARHLIFDRDSIFSPAVIRAVESMGIEPKRTSPRSPWQNGVAERWIGSCRRELLDHVVVLNDLHLVRLVRDYVGYYHEDRCHLFLGKDTPTGRLITPSPSASARVVSLPRVGGLHHRYEWREAA